MTLPISACIICKNEADKIVTCLNSLAWCTDIVVVDSGSTDSTTQIAAAHPAKPRVILQDWLGYSQQREFAVNQCRNLWVLALDADEECSPELSRQLTALNESDITSTAILRLPRKNFIAGRWVRCWSPDYQDRLLHRQRTIWPNDNLPEVRRPSEGFGIKTLASPLLHNRAAPYGLRDLCDGPVMVERAQLLAQNLFERGAHAGFRNIFFRPLLTFIKYYILRGGFLQGRFGLVVCYKTTIGVMLKYSVLYGQQELAGKQPMSKQP
jgi:(heptosyl)LPS beta-1,4-glucosyltransferase